MIDEDAEDLLGTAVHLVGRCPMHEVRVYQNQDEGTLWWAEDDLGFTGGADRLADLVVAIHEWADAEGVLDALQIRLVAAEAATPA